MVVRRRLRNETAAAADPVGGQSVGVDVSARQRIVDDGSHRRLDVGPEEASLERREPLAGQIDRQEVVATIERLRRDVEVLVLGESLRAADHDQRLGRRIAWRRLAEIAGQHCPLEWNLDVFELRFEELAGSFHQRPALSHRVEKERIVRRRRRQSDPVGVAGAQELVASADAMAPGERLLAAGFDERRGPQPRRPPTRRIAVDDGLRRGEGLADLDAMVHRGPERQRAEDEIHRRIMKPKAEVGGVRIDRRLGRRPLRRPSRGDAADDDGGDQRRQRPDGPPHSRLLRRDRHPRTPQSRPPLARPIISSARTAKPDR